ncbi:MAG TPA: hypothetical protein VIE43_04250 [Thermoanaerobaculia bacterium]|nr:hypothetical protein [Thermoanaerobaculia bacterium]
MREPPDPWRPRPEFTSGLIRFAFRGVFFASLIFILMPAIYVGEAILFEPRVVRPVIAYAVTIACGALSLAAALRLRGPSRWIMRLSFAVIALCLVLHLVLLDGLFGSVFAADGEPGETVYAKGYSSTRFWFVTKGMTRKEVLDSLGEPLVDVWSYVGPTNHETIVDFEHNHVTQIEFGFNPPLDSVSLGMTAADILRRMGPPAETLFLYSRGSESYSERVIRFRHDRVAERISDYYWD